MRAENGDYTALRPINLLTSFTAMLSPTSPANTIMITPMLSVKTSWIVPVVDEIANEIASTILAKYNLLSGKNAINRKAVIVATIGILCRIGITTSIRRI